jgi:ferrous iron transport protein B
MAIPASDRGLELEPAAPLLQSVRAPRVVPRLEDAGSAVAAEPRQEERARPTIVLVGNPNVGKSVLFKNLTGRYVTVSNFPGTTVEIVRARASFDGRRCDVVDTPGLNDLSPRSDDARVTRDLLDQLDSPTLVQVADARNLRRALLLTLQLSELELPLVLVLNMFDELAERGGRVDVDRLAATLGIPVVTSVAVRNQGTAEIVEALTRARPPRFRVEGLEEVEGEYERNRARLAAINEILAEVSSFAQPARAPFAVRLGFWAMHPVKGLFFVGLALLFLFWFVGLFGAGTLVDFLEVAVFEQRVSPLAIGVADRLLPFDHVHEMRAVPYTLGVPLSPVHEIALGSWETTARSTAYTVASSPAPTSGEIVLRFLHDFLVGQYGAVTMALSYAFAIVLPIVTTFFLLFSVLEDSGYLPRMAILVNRLFRLMGLNGKAILPMVLGLGCDTMATMTTRILETRRERVVTTMLLALAVPCSAQLGVLLAMMATLSVAAALSWTVLMVGVLLAVGWLTSRLFGGSRSEFILEIPPMRRPQLGNVWRKTVARLDWYLREVIPLFVIGTAALFLLDRLHLLQRIARLGEPLVTGWLGLPAEMSNAFLVGFLRRDFGAVYILDAATGVNPVLAPHQIFVAMITITLFMPCFANFLMIAKEHGYRVAWSMAAFIFPFAFLTGGLVQRLGRWLPIW